MDVYVFLKQIVICYNTVILVKNILVMSWCCQVWYDTSILNSATIFNFFLRWTLLYHKVFPLWWIWWYVLISYIFLFFSYSYFSIFVDSGCYGCVCSILFLIIIFKCDCTNQTSQIAVRKFEFWNLSLRINIVDEYWRQCYMQLREDFMYINGWAMLEC